MNSHYLTVYDYGMGGVWAFIEASSAQAIRDELPFLIVHEGRPNWMSPQEEQEIAHEWKFQLGHRPYPDWVEMLLKDAP